MHGCRNQATSRRHGAALRVHAFLLAVVLGLNALGVLVGPQLALAADAPGPGVDDPALYAAVQPDQRAAIQKETAGQLSSYVIEAALSGDDASLVGGTVELRFVNDTERELSEIYLRLYANDSIYDPEGIMLGDVTSDGGAIPVEFAVDETVARLPLPSPLAAGMSVDLTIPFTTSVPDSHQGYGMFGVAENSGTTSLAHWYPILAGYGPDGVWNLDPPSVNGDPIFSNTALYEVTLTAPTGLRIVTTGHEVAREATGDDLTRYEFVSGPARDFIVVADDDFDVVEDEVDGTLVRSWFNPRDTDGGERVLRYGVQALELFNDLFGSYPYEEMDLVQVPISNGAAGVEFPQLMLISERLYSEPEDVGVPGFLENVVAHEVVHQWWYALVGNNQYEDAFLDEGLTNYLSTAVYFERFYSPEIGEEQVDFYLRVPYVATLFDRGDEIVDQPTDDFTQRDYGVMVYGKGALGFGAIHDAIGDDAFFAALQDYYETMRFEVVTPDDLLAAFERAAGRELGELWRHWFEAAEGDQDFSPDDLTGDRDSLAA